MDRDEVVWRQENSHVAGYLGRYILAHGNLSYIIIGGGGESENCSFTFMILV